MAETKTATLTHKVRNPQNLDEWLDIWTATAITTIDGNNTTYNYEITPSANWNISADNLGEIPVNKVIPTNFYNNEEQKNYTITNVTITSEPTNDNLGLTGNTVAIINKDGSLKESSGSFDEEETSYFNGKGEFVTLPSYSLTGATYNTSNVEVILNKDTNAASNIIINGSGKITTTYNNNNNTITFNLAENSVGTNELQDDSVGTSELQNNSVTPEKIDWDYEDNTDPYNPITMASKIKQTIDINSFTNDGIVPATNGDMQLSWATDNSGNPAWRSGQISVPNKYITSTSQTFLRGFSNSQDDSSIVLIENENDDYKIIFKEDNAITNSSLTTDTNNQHNISYEVFYE